MSALPAGPGDCRSCTSQCGSCGTLWICADAAGSNRPAFSSRGSAAARAAQRATAATQNRTAAGADLRKFGNGFLLTSLSPVVAHAWPRSEANYASQPPGQAESEPVIPHNTITDAPFKPFRPPERKRYRCEADFSAERRRTGREPAFVREQPARPRCPPPAQRSR